MYSHKMIKMFKILDMLTHPQGVTIEGMTQELKISRRTFYRYIRQLEDMDFPIYTDEPIGRKEEKRWKLQPEFVKRLPNRISIPELNLSFNEIAALYLLKMQNRFYLETDIEWYMNSAFRKIDALLPNKFSDMIEKMESIFLVNASFAKDFSDKEELIDDLIRAVLQKKVCKVEYFSFSSERTKSYDIEPLYFFEHKGGLYLFVRVPKRDVICTLAVERMQSIQVKNNEFEYPEDFDPEEYLNMAFDLMFDDPVKGRLWFTEHQTKYICERQYFQKQEITEQDDGSIIVDFETSGWWDVKSWILSFGPNVKVLEPEEMRKEIHKDITLMLEYYNTK